MKSTNETTEYIKHLITIINTLKERNEALTKIIINNYMELDRKDVYIKYLEMEIERLKHENDNI